MKLSAMAGFWRRGMALLLLVVCSSVLSVSAASALPNYVEDLQGLNRESQDFTGGLLRHRSLLQVPTAAPNPTPPALAPALTPSLPAAPALTPSLPAAPALTPSLAPGPAPVLPPAPAPLAPPAPPTPVRTYLMYAGIAAFCLVFVSVAVFCLCRKFGENKIRGAQRLPPLPRYH